MNEEAKVRFYAYSLKQQLFVNIRSEMWLGKDQPNIIKYKRFNNSIVSTINNRTKRIIWCLDNGIGAKWMGWGMRVNLN